MVTVKLANLSKDYWGRVRAVVNLSLQVRDSEFLALVGPSGCGKSTLLRMIAGLERPTRGTIHFDDWLINDVAPRHRGVAMVFQDPVLYPHLNVFQNLAFPLRLRKAPRDSIGPRVQTVAELLGLTELLERRPMSLSGGQRQRVALGRAIVREPNVFLFDEPLAHLDAHLRLRMRAEIKRLHQRLQTTSIYVTHDQEEAVALGQRVAVMSDGVLHQCAAPRVLRDEPVNRFVAGFIGTPPMNFWDGRLQVDRSGGLQFVSPSLSCTLTPPQSARLSRYAGHAAQLGVRPESLSSVTHTRPGTVVATLRATIEAIDDVGVALDHHLRFPSGEQGIARLSQVAGPVGQECDWHFDPGTAYFFEQDRPGDPISYGRNLLREVNGE
jgi:multiple sugar transport system ATP-binding protein